MVSFQPTLNQFIRARQQEYPEAVGDFSQVMNAIALAGKLISREINLAGIVDATGYTGRMNVQGEEVAKLDEWATVLAAAAFLISLGLTVASPVAALGVLRRRKWGWHLAVLTFLVWTLAWPPVGLLGLYAFCRRPVRRAFLGLAWHEVD